MILEASVVTFVSIALKGGHFVWINLSNKVFLMTASFEA